MIIKSSYIHYFTSCCFFDFVTFLFYSLILSVLYLCFILRNFLWYFVRSEFGSETNCSSKRVKVQKHFIHIRVWTIVHTSYTCFLVLLISRQVDNPWMCIALSIDFEFHPLLQYSASTSEFIAPLLSILNMGHWERHPNCHIQLWIQNITSHLHLDGWSQSISHTDGKENQGPRLASLVTQGFFVKCLKYS